MRRFILRNKWVTASLVVLFLLANSGMALSRMTCLVGGHSELSVGLVDDRCPASESDHGATVSATCCAFSVAQADLNDFLPHAPTVLLPAEGFIERIVVVEVCPRQGVLTSWLDSRPPPSSGPERLVALSIQRV